MLNYEIYYINIYKLSIYKLRFWSVLYHYCTFFITNAKMITLEVGKGIHHPCEAHLIKENQT